MTALTKLTIDLSNLLEINPHEQENSVIDFLTTCNLKNYLLNTEVEKTYNYNDLISAIPSDFYGTFIEIYEKTSVLDHYLDSSNDYISNDYIEPFEETHHNHIDDTDDDIIECLTLKVSAQPWVFAEHDDISQDNFLKPNNFIELQNNIMTDQQNQLNVVKDITQEVRPSIIKYNADIDNDTDSRKLSNFEYVPESTSYHSQNYVIHQLTQCNFHYTPEININKYEALSHAVHNQICSKVIVHDFKSSDTLEIDLYPEKLGKIKIKCNIENDNKIILQVATDKLSTLTLLQQNAIDLQNIIAQSFYDSYYDKTELNFTMSDNQNQQNKENAHYKETLITNIDDNQIVYFLHNGIINLLI